MGVAIASEAAPPTVSLTLLEEISHRVLNEYTLAILGLSAAAAETTSSAAKVALTDAAGRLQAYADVHRLLGPPRGSGRADLANYLARLCGALTAARFSDNGVQLTLVASEAPMSAQRCWRVGLILTELVTNSVRHAFAERGGAVVIQVAARDGVTWCRISDNGRPAAPQAGGGRGLAIVESLTRELGGQIEWDFSSRGATVVLAIPSDAGAFDQLCDEPANASLEALRDGGFHQARQRGDNRSDRHRGQARAASPPV
jgi:two-component sensor histidine kinase